MNISKLKIDHALLIKDMTLLSVYRYSLKLIKTYPSIKRDELREVILLEFREGKNLKNNEEINKAIEQAKMSLNHLVTYELKRRELLDIETNKVEQQFHLGPNHYSIKDKKNKKDEEKFEYFDAI